MKTIIAGSREFSDYDEMCRALDVFEKQYGQVTEVVSGSARGTDKLGERWAKERSIPITRFPAKWNENGKAAGYIRNAEMAAYADSLVAFHVDKSKGTAHMIRLAKERGIYCMVLTYQAQHH